MRATFANDPGLHVLWRSKLCKDAVQGNPHEFRGCQVLTMPIILIFSFRTVSHFIKDMNVCLSLPAVIGRSGVRASIMPSLSPDEMAQLEASAKQLRSVIDEYE